jgi:hypothetical protein
MAMAMVVGDTWPAATAQEKHIASEVVVARGPLHCYI